jgi:leader peptidase (prepilin peptidase)/N-methyltransferase
MSSSAEPHVQIMSRPSPPRRLRNPAPVALLVPLTAAVVFTRYRPGAAGAIAAFMAAVLVVLAAYDLESRIIPNAIVLPATAIVFLAHLALWPDQAGRTALATVCAGAALLIPNLINRSLIGMGDVKLGFLLGAGLGWGFLGAYVIAFASLFPVALVMVIRGGSSARKATIPFGPFLALGGLIILLAPHLFAVGTG